ncbi:MAG: ABC transporter permease [Spirochaetales bacterium]|nr:ABC transporter permease [Spirochaetales bacterium]
MIRIVNRAEISRTREHLWRTLSVALALCASAVIMALIGYNPLEVYAKILQGSLKSAYRFKETIHKAIPLVTLSLGIAVAFRMKFWNIGAEGQFYLGAFGASLVAFYAPPLSPWILLPLMLLSGFFLGGLWALVPALLKARLGASETLVTLMLNYVALKWISYLQYGPWKDPAASGFPKIAPFPDAAILPQVFGIHAGWLIALALCLVVHVMLSSSKLGYEIDVLGESVATARYAGISVTRVTLIAIMISGGLCGIAGMMQASAIEHSLSEQLSGGLGFTAVITTWLARLSPPVILVVSFLFSVLIQGGSFLQSSLKIPASVSAILQGIILFFVLGGEFFIRYRLVRTGRFIFRPPPARKPKPEVRS